MATEVLMPRQGQSVESCIIVAWKVKEGDKVAKGQPLCEVETDKATFEVESPADGSVIKILYPADSDVPVLKTIAYIGAPGEVVAGGEAAPVAADGQAAAGGKSEPQPVVSAAGMPPPPAPAAGMPPLPALAAGMPPLPGAVGSSPRARALAEQRGVNVAMLAGTGPDGRVIERDVASATPAPVSPAAAALAKATGKAIPAEGSGLGGRVMPGDLTAAPAKPAAGMPPPPGTPPPQGTPPPSGATEIAVKGVRKLIAGRMLASLQNTAQLTLNTSADARSILAYREKCKAAPDEAGVGGISLNDMIHYSAVKALALFPELNAHWFGDRMVRYANVHLGFAVDTPRGLMVPVIKNANTLSLKQLSDEAKRLAKACVGGTIAPDDLTGGTFTVTNLGAMGIESFTPVLNTPEVAILGVCAIQPKPVMKGTEVEFVPSMGLSLTFDHCATDGAPAARFLGAIKTRLANFDTLLAG